MAKSQPRQSKRWCFTTNGVTYDQGGPIFGDLCSYYIMGNETAPTTMQPHIQGYCVFKKNMSLTAVKKVCPVSHWEMAKGTTQQNIDYCSKDDGYYLVDRRGSKRIWNET